MQTFNHSCPYCGTQLSVKELDVERIAAKCPYCNSTIILLENGAVMKKPSVYICPKCKEELIYEGRPQFAQCDNCNSLYLTSEQGNCLIDPELYLKGEKGELPFAKKPDKFVALKNKWRLMPIKTKCSLFAIIALTICAAIGLYIYTLPPAIETSKAFADMENVWKEFREKNPYNIQIEGLKRYDDNSYVAIICEPNENVTENDLERFFNHYNCSFKTFRNKIGYDGWLRDAVISFNDLDEDDIPKFASKLSKLLYGTDYKASLMDLNTIPEHTAFSTFDLNYQVTEEELRKWFIEDKEPLVLLDDSTKTTTLTTVLSDNGSQLFLSKSPGFVLWALDIGEQSKEQFRIMARKFSIDSDLILGAISTSSRVVIIGRERCVPIYELPPMRSETLCLLASAEDDELAQSYERTSLYAGKLNGGKDFAPIFLSPQLWHTEYGSILNVTDQMLKSWSENGLIDYIDFDYPKPLDWAFDKGAVSDLGVQTLTYNWNTDGVGYIVEDENYSIYAVNRTGSLPVSYIPGETEGIGASDPVYKAEEKAYNFFSNLSSPELVKVVQYAAMYQIFHNLNIHVESGFIDESQLVEVPAELKVNSGELLYSLASLDKEKRQKLAKFYDRVSVVDAEDYVKNINSKYSQWAFKMPGRMVATTSGESKDDLNQLAAYVYCISRLDTLSIVISEFTDDLTLMRSLSNRLTDRNASIKYKNSPSYGSSPKAINKRINRNKVRPLLGSDQWEVEINLPSISTMSKDEQIGFAIELISKYGFDLQRFNYAISDFSTDSCLKQYVNCNWSKHLEWIKCPTIVLSWSLTDSVNSVGGHNLNSRVSRFKVNRELKPGQTRTIEKNGQKIVEVSAKDARTRVGDQSYLRRYGRLADYHIQGNEIPIRPKTVITKDVSQRSARGYNATDHLSISREGKYYTLNGKKTGTTVEDLISDAVSKIDNGNSHTSITLEFKSVCEDECMAIVEKFGEIRLKKGNALRRIPCHSLDASHIVTEDAGGVVKVKIPLKAEAVQKIIANETASQASMAGSSGNKNVWNRVKEIFLVFRIPKSQVSEFIKFIQDYIKNHSQFRRFEIKQGAKERGIMIQDEIDAFRVVQYKPKKNVYYEKILA